MEANKILVPGRDFIGCPWTYIFLTVSPSLFLFVRYSNTLVLFVNLSNTLVKHWSNTGQTHWSNIGETHFGLFSECRLTRGRRRHQSLRRMGGLCRWVIIIIIIIMGCAPFTYDPFTYHPFYLQVVGKRVGFHHHHHNWSSIGQNDPNNPDRALVSWMLSAMTLFYSSCR